MAPWSRRRCAQPTDVAKRPGKKRPCLGTKAQQRKERRLAAKTREEDELIGAEADPDIALPPATLSPATSTPPVASAPPPRSTLWRCRRDRRRHIRPREQPPATSAAAGSAQRPVGMEIFARTTSASSLSSCASARRVADTMSPDESTRQRKRKQGWRYDMNDIYQHRC